MQTYVTIKKRRNMQTIYEYTVRDEFLQITITRVECEVSL